MSNLTCFTVNLTARAVEALDNTMARTGDTRTDTINRAIIGWDTLLQLVEEGGGTLHFDGTTVTVRPT